MELESITVNIDNHPPVTVAGQAFLRLAGRTRSADEPMPSVTIPSDDDFLDARSEWLEPDDLRQLAVAVMESHPRLGPLLNLRTRFLWRASYQDDGGRVKWGETKRLTQLNHHFADADIAVWLAANWFRQRDVPQAAVEAGLFRQLCHIGFTPKGKPVIVGPDFDGFLSELRAYGAWTPTLRSVRDAIAQLDLPGMEADR